MLKKSKNKKDAGPANTPLTPPSMETDDIDPATVIFHQPLSVAARRSDHTWGAIPSPVRIAVDWLNKKGTLPLIPNPPLAQIAACLFSPFAHLLSAFFISLYCLFTHPCILLCIDTNSHSRSQRRRPVSRAWQSDHFRHLQSPLRPRYVGLLRSLPPSLRLLLLLTRTLLLSLRSSLSHPRVWTCISQFSPMSNLSCADCALFVGDLPSPP